MKNKSFSNKPKAPLHTETERKLLPRLKFIGYVTIVLTLSALTFAIIAPEDPEIGPELVLENIPKKSTAGLSLEEEEPLELSSKEVFNYYVVSGIFALVAASCFLIAWKKKKSFSI